MIVWNLQAASGNFIGQKRALS